MKAAPRARIYRPTPRNLAYLAQRLRAGELVAVPSETVYGLAGNALDVQACREIFRAKGRPRNDPLIVHIHSLDQLHAIAQPNAAALRLARAFWPGPLTLVLPKTDAISPLLTAGRDSVAVRMPSHPVFRRLLQLADIPLAAPSANPFGYVSPTTAAHVADNLGRKIRHILDGGPAAIGLESTILDLRDPARPQILRPGAIGAREIARVLRRRVSVLSATAPSSTTAKHSRAQIAPGLLARHYSPRTPVVLHDRLPAPAIANEAFIFLRKPSGKQPPNIYWLDARGELRGVARRLFATLRAADSGGYRRIHIERASGDELADAINDRLRRAAAR